MWTPDAFSGAPAAAAAFAGTGSKIGVAILLLRLDAAGPPEPVWSVGLALLAVASILLGNLQALRQTSVTRMLGYSSIAHSGYIVAIVAAASTLVPEAVLFYLAGYALALIAAMCAASYAGRDCHLGAALSISLLSLAGLPASAGFFGKFYLFTALIRGEAWGLLIAAAAGSALGLYFYARFAVAIFRQGPERSSHDLGWADAAVLLLCSIAILGFGLNPTPLLDLIRFSVHSG
jgi:NADH-quinone oxidoreductase subunit N